MKTDRGEREREKKKKKASITTFAHNTYSV